MDDQDKTKEQLIKELQELQQAHDSLKATIKADLLSHELIEEELRESEERFKALHNASFGGIAIHDKGIILECNQGLSEMTGYSLDELIGMDGLMLIAPNSRDLVLSNITSGNEKPYEAIGLRKNGELFPMRLEARNVPYKGKNVRTVEFRDITESKQAEEALQASKDYLDKIINSVASPIFVKDDKHRFTLVNEAFCKLLNLPAEQLIGITGFEYFPKEQVDVFIAKDQEVLNTGKENINEELVTDAQGIIKTFVTRKTLYTDSSGNKFLVGVGNDVTESKQYEQDLIIAKERAEESDRLKSAFLANMSHEIRTPMNGILGFAGLLKKPELSGEKQQEYLQIIEKSGVRMLNIINDIVDISKIEAGLMKLTFSESDINKQIEYIYTFFKPQVEAKGMKLSFRNSLPAKEAIVKTDREKLFAILTNLVKNALKYSDKGTIEFGYNLKPIADSDTEQSRSAKAAPVETVGELGEAHAPAELEFYVKDTGIGIPKDRQQAIFERFIQADITDSRAFQGAGLGLSIAKAYIHMLGGRIWVESEEGIGSCFYFTLPYIAEPVIETIDQQLAASVKTDNSRKLKILIAEDDEVSEMLIDIIVETLGKEIFKVRTGVAAIEACREHTDIDLILMDIRMPEMDGYEAARQIRKFNKEVVIIAQTAYGLSRDREKSIEAGCNDYIAKPINKNELLALIQKYFGK